MRLVLLFACLFCFSFSIGFGQSVYEDAKKLLKMFETPKNKVEYKKLWVEFTEIKPLYNVYINQDNIYFSKFSTINGTINSIGSQDYILDNIPLNGVFKINTTDTSDIAISEEVPIKEKYYIIRIENKKEIRRISLISPDGEIAYIKNLGPSVTYILLEIKLITGELSKEDHFIYLGDGNLSYCNSFKDNNLPLNNRFGYFFFESLDWNDSLLLISSGKTVLSIYPKFYGILADSLYVESEKELKVISLNDFYFENRFNEIVLRSKGDHNTNIFLMEKTNKDTSFILKLIPKFEMSCNASYLFHSNAKRYEKGINPIAFSNSKMSLSPATYNFCIDQPLTKATFYKDNDTIGSIRFNSNLSFSYLEDQTDIETFTYNFLSFKNKKTNIPYSNYSINIDTLTLSDIEVFDKNYIEYGKRAYCTFIFLKCRAGTEKCIWDTIHSVSIYENGLYRAVFDMKYMQNEYNEGNFKNFAYARPIFVDKNSNITYLPIEWNPFIDQTLEFSVRDDKITFKYIPALERVKNIISIYRKDSIPTLLASHSHLKKSDLQTQNLWADISARYRNNPFLAGPLKNNLAQGNFEQIPGMPDDSLRRKLSAVTAADYPWQGVLFDNGRLEADQAVSYQDKVESYRTPVVTASDNLQTASDQFGSASKKLKRGLSTADLAAGLSDFIVERAQEELNVTFLSRLREGILGDTAEFTVLFPETRKMLSEFRIVQYRTLLDFAKNAFILDLRNLGVNFPKLFKLKQDKYRKIWNDPRVYNIFLLYDIANKVYENMPAETILLHIHKQLHERRMEVAKSINERLAQTILSHPDVGDTLTKLVTRYESRLKKFEAIHDTLIKENTAKWEGLFAESPDRKANQQLLSNWKIHIKNREYTLAIKNIKGDPDYAYVRDSLPFEAHQAYFAKSPDSIQVISTGIDWAGTLLSRDSILGYFEQIAAMEARLAVMDSIKWQQEADSARANRQLSAYIPIFERYRDIMTQRACLELALAAEIHLDTMAKPKRLTEHDRQALIYLQQVLKSPNNYKLYNWSRLDTFNSRLIASALDNCIVCRPDAQVEPKVCNLSGSPLGEYQEKLKMFNILEDIEPISSEMEKAREFLDKMAIAIKVQFNEIARDTAYKNAPNISDLADTVYYNQFLFSREMTERTLAFNYEKFLLKMQEVIKADKGGGKNMPDWEVLKNDNLKRHVRNYQEAWRRNTIARDIAGNYFLDYYNQAPPFDTSLWTVQSKGTMAQLLDGTRSAIAALDSVSRQFHDYIDTLQNKYAGDLLRSLKQTGEFGLLTQITLQWLYAFQDAPEQADSVVLRDSTLQHVVQFEPAGKEPKPDDIETEAADKKNKLSDAKTAPADKKQKPGDIKTAQYDRQVSYDTIRVNKRKIGDRRWITPKKFNDMMEDTLLRRCFMGLLYQRLAAIEGGARYDARSMALLATKFMNTIYDIDDRREMLRYKKETNQPLRFEDYYPFIRSTVDMLNFVLETPFQAGGDPLIERFETLRDVPKISNEVLSLFENVFAENYPNAIHNVVQLLSITWGLDVKTTGQKPREGAAAANKNEKRPPQPKLTREDKKNIKVKSAILTYGSFMANMVGAQTPEQVKAAIRAVALPAGSSSIKRNSAFNVSVNSYLGLGGYREFLTDETIPGDQRAGITFGLSVPVGAAFSWANRDAAFNRKKWKRLSYSVFIPVIDLGAITAYRIDQKNVNAALPELNFGNIIAPGAYFMVNFPRSPFTLGAGWQWGPQLRKITIDNNTEITSRAWRIGLTASIDVPIFNIFTSRE